MTPEKSRGCEDELNYSEILGLDNIRSYILLTPTGTLYPQDAEDFVKDSMIAAGIAEPRLIYLVAGAKELVANAIEHGNKRDSRKKVEIVCGWNNARFYFVAKDEGDGFDINNCRRVYREDRGYGLITTQRAVSRLYNFRDSASYFMIDI